MQADWPQDKEGKESQVRPRGICPTVLKVYPQLGKKVIRAELVGPICLSAQGWAQL